MKTFEFTEDACKMLSESLELKLQMNRELLQELKYYKDTEYAKKKEDLFAPKSVSYKHC